MTDQLTRITTTPPWRPSPHVAATISYRHAYELVTTPRRDRLTATLPFAVDGLILAP